MMTAMTMAIAALAMQCLFMAVMIDVVAWPLWLLLLALTMT